MTRERSEVSDKRSEATEMAFTAEATLSEMRGHIRLIAGLALEDSRKAALRFAAGALQMPFDRVRRIFYGEARQIHAHEADRIRAYVQQAEDLIRAREAYERQRAEFLAGAGPVMRRLAPPSLPKLVMEPPPKVKRRA